MNKKSRKLITVLLLVASACALALGAAAASGIYAGSGTLSQSLKDSYAVGSGGTALIGSGDVYVLTGDGLTTLSDAASGGSAAGDYTGGGGLVSESGTVAIRSDVVLVGLKYYFSPSRDTGLEAANLENAVGSGYEYGYYDSDRQFHAEGSTAETKLTMRVTSGTGIGVYVTGTDTLLYEADSTGPTSMLGIRPLSTGGDAVTWFAGYKYYGGFEYAVLGAGKITVVNVVGLEQYVQGVCASEMNGSWPLEALKAQSVAARTYAGRYIENSLYYYNCGFDLTADTYSQAYAGCSKISGSIPAAVAGTENQFLTYKGALCDAQFFSSDGGGTEDNENVNGNSAHPYLKGVLDPYEAKTDAINYYSSWSYTMTSEKLAAKVGLSDVVSADAEYSDTGNVIAVTFTSSDGQTAALTKTACRSTLGLPSIRYTVTESDGSFVFDGSGWGHSLGMSQYGAYAMANYYGKTYKDILGFYYTGVGLSYGGY